MEVQIMENQKLLRVLSIVFLAVLILGLVACNQPVVSSTPSASAPPHVSSAPSAVASQSDAVGLTEPVKLDFATMNLGSAWYAYAGVLSEVMRESLPVGSQINVLDQAGGGGNPKIVSAKTADLALGYNTLNYWAYTGTVLYDQPLDNLRGIAGTMDETFVLAVTSEKSGITDLGQIKDNKMGITLMTAGVGSTGEAATRKTLEAYDMSYDDIKSWGGTVEHTDFSTIVDAFRDGKADLFIHVVSAGHATLTEMALTTKLSFVSIGTDQRKAMIDDFGFIAATMPVNTFNGQTEEVETLGITTCVFTHKDLSDDVAYALAKSIAEGVEDIHTGHNALKVIDKNTVADKSGMGLPLHPGAEKYYKEAGLLK